MKKTYLVKVGTRNRITVPMDCWMDVGNMKNLILENTEHVYEWLHGVGMTKKLSYRVAVPYKIGTTLELIPSKNKRSIIMRPYINNMKG